MTKTNPVPQEVIRSPRLDIANRVSEMDTPMLRAELARALTVTAETLAYLGEVWRELERRGEDLSDIRAGLGQYLPRIAAGQLDAEVVVRFAGRQALLRAVGSLPINEQRRLALGGKVKVVSIGEAGKIEEAAVPVAMLTTQQVRIVFDEGRVRSVAEQQNIIDSARVAARRRQKEPRRYRLHVDRAAGQLRVGNMTVPVEEVVSALRGAGMLPGADDAQ